MIIITHTHRSHALVNEILLYGLSAFALRGSHVVNVVFNVILTTTQTS